LRQRQNTRSYLLPYLTQHNHLTITPSFAVATFSLNYHDLWDHSIVPPDYFVIGHYWTLALEEQFYLTWPLLILLFKKRRLTQTLWIIIAIAPFIRIASYFLFPTSREQIGLMFHTSFDSIAAGVLLGELLQKTRPAAILKKLASNRQLITIAILFLTILSPILAHQFRGTYRVTIGQTLELASICLILTSAIHIPNTKLYRLLNWRPLTHIGILSYSLYLPNFLFLYSGGKASIHLFPLNYLSLIAIALLSYHLIEKPFLKLKTQLHHPTRQEPANLPKQ
jgi:peptidoglycan/LPS O-acetylase OafA/YrhL